MKFLFFAERELHIPMFINIIREIEAQKLGQIGLYTFTYAPSTGQRAGWGLRPQIRELLGNCCQTVEDPLKWQPDITFVADFSFQYVEGLGFIVNVGHGTISKGWYFSKKNISRRENCADLLCVPGAVHKKQLAEQVYIPVVITGMPKLDTVFNATKADVRIWRQKLGLDPDRATVLLAPTFNHELSLLPHLQKNLGEYIPDIFNLIIKLHGATDEALVKKINELARTRPRTCFYEHPDIAPALLASDVLITDLSSVIYEFAAQNRPVLLFDSPWREQYPNRNPDDLEFTHREVGQSFTDVNTLPILLLEAVNRGTLNSRQADMAAEMVAPTGGHAAATVLQKAMELYNQRTLRGTVIIMARSQNYATRLARLYKGRYEVICCGCRVDGCDCGPATGNFWADANAAVARAGYSNVMIITQPWEPSPHLPVFLFNHLHFDKSIGAVFTLVDKQNAGEFDLQFVGHWLKIGGDDNRLNSIQLTYSACGENRLLRWPLHAPCFAFNKHVWPQVTPGDNPEASLAGLLQAVYRNNQRTVVALDTMVHRAEEENSQRGLLQPPPLDEAAYLTQLQQNPSDSEALWQLALTYYFYQSWPRCLDYARRIDDPARRAFLVASVWWRQGYGQEAREALTGVVTEDTLLKAELLTLKARIEQGDDNWGESGQLLQNALALQPGLRTACLAKLKQPELEQTERNELIGFLTAEFADDTEVMLLMAQEMSRSGDWPAARQQLVGILEKDDQMRGAVKELVNIWEHLSPEKAEMGMVEDYLSTHPGDVDLHCRAAKALHKNGETALAAGMAQTAALFDRDYVCAAGLDFLL